MVVSIKKNKPDPAKICEIERLSHPNPQLSPMATWTPWREQLMTAMNSCAQNAIALLHGIVKPSAVTPAITGYIKTVWV